jgi:hypothetical protein
MFTALKVLFTLSCCLFALLSTRTADANKYSKYARIKPTSSYTQDKNIQVQPEDLFHIGTAENAETSEIHIVPRSGKFSASYGEINAKSAMRRRIKDKDESFLLSYEFLSCTAFLALAIIIKTTAPRH